MARARPHCSRATGQTCVGDEVRFARLLNSFATVLIRGTLLHLPAFIREVTTTSDVISRRSFEEGLLAPVTLTADGVVDCPGYSRDDRTTDRESTRTELIVGVRTATAWLFNNVDAAVGVVTSVTITGFLTTTFLDLLGIARSWQA